MVGIIMGSRQHFLDVLVLRSVKEIYDILRKLTELKLTKL